MVHRLGQERLADIPVRPLLLPPPLRRVRLTVDQPDAQDRACPRQPRIGKGGAVVAVENVRYAPPGDGAAEKLLAEAGVLPVVEPAVDQQPGVVIDDQEQPGPRRPVPFRVRHPRADQHIGDPPLVRPLRLVAAVRFRGGFEGGPVQPGAAQLPADGPVRDPHAVPVIQDRGDLRCGPAGQFQPQRGGLGEQLRHRAYLPGVGPGRGAQRIDPAGPPRPQPPVDGAARVPAHRPVRVRVLARGDLPHDRAPLAASQPGVRGLGDHRPPVQRDLLPHLLIHHTGTSCSRRRDACASRAPGRHETPPADHQPGRGRVGGQQAPAGHRAGEPPPAQHRPPRQPGRRRERRRDRRHG